MSMHDAGAASAANTATQRANNLLAFTERNSWLKAMQWRQQRRARERPILPLLTMQTLVRAPRRVEVM
jgi:hypothetical protein